MDLTEFEHQLATIGRAHDRAWDELTLAGRDRRMKDDPEALYHWQAAAACEELFNRCRQSSQLDRIMRAAGISR